MAKANKHYSIDETKKIIYADILSLTEKEEAEVSKFLKFGYTIANKVKEKNTVKRIDEEFILDYLKDDSNAIEEYKKAKAEPARDENGNKKLTGTGKVRTRGFNAGRNWFSKKYPLNVEDAEKAIKEANMKDLFDTVYKAYSNKEVKEGESLLTKEEYTRDFYWKKVFINDKKTKEE